MKIFKYKFNTNQSNNLKILTISDLHIFNNKDNKKLEPIINLVKNNNYDCIFIAGDLIDSTNILKDNIATNNLINKLNYLASLSPIYYCLGNHDLCAYSYNYTKTWSSDEKNFKEKFYNILKENPNIHVSPNTSYEIKKGYTINLINPPLKYILNTNNELKDLNKFNFLKNLKSTNINILLCHYPNWVIALFQNGYLKNINLCLCGHTHNGLTQLKLPVESILNKFNQNNRGFITPNKSFKLKDTKLLRGKITLDEKTTLIINPAYTSLSKSAGLLHSFDFLFYNGITEIEFFSSD